MMNRLSRKYAVKVSSPAIFLVGLLALLPSANAQKSTPLYVIDPVETHSRFEAMFLGFITVRGKFNRTTGTLNHEPDRTDVEARSGDAITAVIDSTTLDAHVVNSHATNKVLRGPDFFNVEKFPSIEFRSSRFLWSVDKENNKENNKENDQLNGIEGTLTLLGVTKPVTLIVQKSGCTPASPTKRARCTADAFLSVKRSDFGMKAWSSSVSDEVKIIVELVAFRVAETPRDTSAIKAVSEKQEERKMPETIPPEAKPEIVKPEVPKQLSVEFQKQKPSSGGQ